jgi:hypothetical protein
MQCSVEGLIWSLRATMQVRMQSSTRAIECRLTVRREAMSCAGYVSLSGSWKRTSSQRDTTGRLKVPGRYNKILLPHALWYEVNLLFPEHNLFNLHDLSTSGRDDRGIPSVAVSDLGITKPGIPLPLGGNFLPIAALFCQMDFSSAFVLSVVD